MLQITICQSIRYYLSTQVAKYGMKKNERKRINASHNGKKKLCVSLACRVLSFFLQAQRMICAVWFSLLDSRENHTQIIRKIVSQSESCRFCRWNRLRLISCVLGIVFYLLGGTKVFLLKFRGKISLHLLRHFEPRPYSLLGVILWFIIVPSLL